MGAFAPRYTITDRIAADLTVIERARGFLEAATLSDQWLRQMSERALIAEAHATTHIEGTELTLAEAEQLWEGKDVPGARDDDVRELLNYRGAFDLVAESVAAGDAVSEGWIREIHKRLVEGVRGSEAQPGVYRTVQNYVARGRSEIVYTPPAPAEVPALMRDLVDWLRERNGTSPHPVLVAGIAQFQLVHIHPFVDGNGRTSRLLSMLCLYRAGYDFKRLFTLSEYYDRDRKKFYEAIQAVRNNGMDLTGWLEFFTSALAAQLSEVKTRGETIIRRDVLVNENRLNERQAVAVQRLLETNSIDIKTFESLCPDASRRSLQRDLAELEALGVVRHEGATNNVVYVMVWKGGGR